MARDYKHRVQNPSYGGSRRRNKKAPSMWWRWLLVIALVVAFVVFLNMIRGMVAELMVGKPEAEVSQTAAVVKQEISLLKDKPVTPVSEPEKKAEPEKPVQPEEPRYDF
jgi:hypothetical protein